MQLFPITSPLIRRTTENVAWPSRNCCRYLSLFHTFCKRIVPTLPPWMTGILRTRHTHHHWCLMNSRYFIWYLHESLRLQQFWENGIMDRMFAKFTPKIDKCMVDKKEPPKLSPLKLVDLSSAFVILGIGCGLSLVAFLFEMCMASLQRSRKLKIAPNN